MLMEKLNNASSGIVSKIIFGLIGVSFVLSGVAGYMFIRTDTSVAKSKWRRNFSTSFSTAI